MHMIAVHVLNVSCRCEDILYVVLIKSTLVLFCFFYHWLIKGAISPRLGALSLKPGLHGARAVSGRQDCGPETTRAAVQEILPSNLQEKAFQQGTSSSCVGLNVSLSHYSM